MSSGSYFPPPVKLVEIPKTHGEGVRGLGVPTVADRVAQTVVAFELEKSVEPMFHSSSYGYRPRRSPEQAVAACRERCFTHPWVLDCDIQGFFDNVPHDLIVKAVEANTDEPWVVLYVKRWLQAPVQHPDGTLEHRDRGTPQGSAISPLLANMFMHYAFDAWMEREFPTVAFERYCDDFVVHCFSEKQARYVRRRIEDRLGECGLRLHPDKTRIVFCQQDGREGSHEHTSFTFLGFTFRKRAAQGRAGPRGSHLQRLPSCCQHRRDAQDVADGAQLAAAPADHKVPERSRDMGQQDRVRMDQLLRPVLPDRVDPALTPNQCLHCAMGVEEVQASGSGPTNVQCVVASGHRA